MRMDKWLWAARFFKTRALAARACDFGRVTSNGYPAKPMREVRIGDILTIKNDTGDFTIEVLGLSQMRGPAGVARTLFQEGEESKAKRLEAAELRKAMTLAGGFTESKPEKRDRRLLNRMRGR
ncbi:MAG: RNA-binding S4 domain-containing protein [Acidobacteria bacterium]|nr:RNA-binding S4 domain-containing protein [Acidobacteriota bacterium]